MKCIEIISLKNGSHRNINLDGITGKPDDGWAVIPDTMYIPDTFPFVNITVENGVVTSMTAGTVPEPEPEPEPEPTTDDVLNVLLGVSE